MFNDNTIQVYNVIFTVEYSPPGFANDVVLDARLSGIPEPSWRVLLGFGLTAVGVGVARKSRKAMRS